MCVSKEQIISILYGFNSKKFEVFVRSWAVRNMSKCKNKREIIIIKTFSTFCRYVEHRRKKNSSLELCKKDEEEKSFNISVKIPNVLAPVFSLFFVFDILRWFCFFFFFLCYFLQSYTQFKEMTAKNKKKRLNKHSQKCGIRKPWHYSKTIIRIKLYFIAILFLFCTLLNINIIIAVETIKNKPHDEEV